MTFIPRVMESPLTGAVTVRGEKYNADLCRYCSRAGFTLIELMIVISIIGILAAIAVPSYQASLIRAREAVLRENLYSIRSAIDQFAADRSRYPFTLQELVEQRYLHGIPIDPFTRSRESWIIMPPPAATVAEGQVTGDGTAPLQGNVYDLHSGSNLVGSDNTPYNEW